MQLRGEEEFKLLPRFLGFKYYILILDLGRVIEHIFITFSLLEISTTFFKLSRVW